MSIDLALHTIMTYSNGMKSAIARPHNFHLPLPESTYQRLKSTAKRQSLPATQLAKQALEQWLDEQEKMAVHEEIARYAATVAGSVDDLDASLESAALEHLDNSGTTT
jgi:predicted DNA-binding protein